MGNMKAPGQDDLIARIRRLERRLDEAQRGTTQRDICKVNLALSNSLPNGHQRIVTSWDSFAEVDTAGMFRRDVEGQSWMEIPYAGRWRVVNRGVWGQPPTSGSRVSGSWITLNDIHSNYAHHGNAVDFDLVYHPGQPYTSFNTHAESSRVFAAGDRIGFGYWSDRGTSSLLGRNDRPTSPSFILAEYIGPK